MPTYELINPSDPYTLVSDDPNVAAVACMILGEGWYSLRDEAGQSVCPIFLPGADPDDWLRPRCGLSAEEFLTAHRVEIAECLETVLIGGFGDRVEVQAATSRMTTEAATSWLTERHDRRRSSLNDIGKRARGIAAALRSGPVDG